MSLRAVIPLMLNARCWTWFGLIFVLLTTLLCLETKCTSVVTAHLAGKAIPAIMLSQMVRIMFRYIQFAFKSRQGNKGHSLFFPIYNVCGRILRHSAIRYSLFDIRIFLCHIVVTVYRHVKITPGFSIAIL